MQKPLDKLHKRKLYIFKEPIFNGFMCNLIFNFSGFTQDLSEKEHKKLTNSITANVFQVCYLNFFVIVYKYENQTLFLDFVFSSLPSSKFLEWSFSNLAKIDVAKNCYDQISNGNSFFHLKITFLLHQVLPVSRWDDNACLGVRNTSSIEAWPNSLDRRLLWYCISSVTNKQTKS